MPASILVTGSSGFIGAWIVKDLLERQKKLVLFDCDPSQRRLVDIMPGDPRNLTTVAGDIADLSTLRDLIDQHEVTSIIHLAGLQIPTCRADPLAGAQVNVGGTLAVFEAARAAGTVEQVVYASSAAVIGPEACYPPGRIPNDAPLYPATHYGVFKQCNEGNAHIYFQDHGINSVGLRPWTVYGVGRDQGVTSDATRAIKSAAVGRPFMFRYSGRNALQYAGDVAASFVLSALTPAEGARTYNLRGTVVEMTDYIQQIEDLHPAAKGLITLSGNAIPVACDLDDAELRAYLPDLPDTSLRDGIRQTLESFQSMQDSGTLDTADLDV